MEGKIGLLISLRYVIYKSENTGVTSPYFAINFASGIIQIDMKHGHVKGDGCWLWYDDASTVVYVHREKCSSITISITNFQIGLVFDLSYKAMLSLSSYTVKLLVHILFYEDSRE